MDDMFVITKAVAEIHDVDETDEPNGAFEVVLSTPSQDREGEKALTEEWEQPLPDHITFDTDHAMTVAGTVGSGKPYLAPDGTLRVSGTYASTPKAQETRALVNEGHIRTVSVTFLRKRAGKGMTGPISRELLNGTFCAVPVNPEARILSSKAVTAKAGSRNSAKDQTAIQSAHDSLVGAGAMCSGEKAIRPVVKAVDGSYEQRQEAIYDALRSAYPGDDQYAYTVATFDDSIVYRVSGSGVNDGQWQASYTYTDGAVEIADPVRVNMVETIEPLGGKAVTDPDEDDPSAVAAPKAAAPAAADEAATADDMTVRLRGRTLLLGL